MESAPYVKIQRVDDLMGSDYYEEIHWHCEPPPDGEPWFPVEYEWVKPPSPPGRIRHVYKYELGRDRVARLKRDKWPFKFNLTPERLEVIERAEREAPVWADPRPPRPSEIAVRAVADSDPSILGRGCALCSTDLWYYDHDTSCLWRMAKEWVADHDDVS